MGGARASSLPRSSWLSVKQGLAFLEALDALAPERLAVLLEQRWGYFNDGLPARGSKKTRCGFASSEG